MDERAKKRKLEHLQQEETEATEDDHDTNTDFVRDGLVEQPGEGLARKDSQPRKQARVDSPGRDTEQSARKRVKEEQRALKWQKKEDKKAAWKDSEAKTGYTSSDRDVALPEPPKSLSIKRQKSQSLQEKAARPGAAPEDPAATSTHHDETSPTASLASDFAGESPVFDTSTPINDAAGEAAGSTTPLSSTTALDREQTRKHKGPADSTALRERLAAKIEALRAARKADGKNGKPIRTRQELIEVRREKQAERKAHKKELRRQAKEEEERKREEALASARNSPGGILSPAVELNEESATNSFAYGRVAFADGTTMSHDLSYAKDPAAKKRSDPKTALAKLAAQKSRLAGLDVDKRKEVLEKETWLAARRRAEGDKVHDDQGLLKKAVKRKEKAKKRSETEWKNRSNGVQLAIKEKQNKREENIQKRKDQKFLGKSGKKKGGKPPPSKSKNRAGFEGRFGSSKK
jgi:hypothetical protein